MPVYTHPRPREQRPQHLPSGSELRRVLQVCGGNCSATKRRAPGSRRDIPDADRATASPSRRIGNGVIAR